MRKLFLSISFVYFSVLGYSQIPDPPTTALSPNSAGLGRFGNHEVSLFRGTPNIQIPLFEFNQNGLSFPINLSYDASGVRSDVHPGWVGMNWNLTAGGAITRTVKDEPDEMHLQSGSETFLGFYYQGALLNRADWNSLSYLRQVAQSWQMYGDTEPDEFSFNFLDYSGKFYRTHDGQWAVQCTRPVKVIFEEGDFIEPPFEKRNTDFYGKNFMFAFAKFTIIGEDGTKYVFGGNNESIEYSVDFFAQAVKSWVATTWNLSKIILTNGQSIDLTYERGDFINQMYWSIYQNLGFSMRQSGVNRHSCSGWGINNLLADHYQGMLISPVYLSRINSPNYRIDFERSKTQELSYTPDIYHRKWFYWGNGELYRGPFLTYLKSYEYEDDYRQCQQYLQWHKLDKITIRHKSGGDIELKEFDFAYNNNPNQRLMLLNLTEKGKPSHDFSYRDAERLPAYLYGFNDHWGFYNGRAAATGWSEVHSIYRTPNEITLQYGILEKIVYPTGGYTKFEFEPHRYRKQLQEQRWNPNLIEYSSNQLAGGLRIKTITDSPSPTGEGSTSRNFYYVSDYISNREAAQVSSGVLGGQFRYTFSDYQLRSWSHSNTTGHRNVFSSGSIMPTCNNAHGSHIGYSKVVEKRGDGSFIEYTFSNFDNGCLDDGPDQIIQISRTPYEPYSSREQERGLLLKKDVYALNAQTPLHRTENTYEKDDSSISNYVRCMKAKSELLCICGENHPAVYDEGTAYRIYTYSMRPKTTTETFYNHSGTRLQSSTTVYTYDNHKQLTSVTRTDSKGEQVKTEYKYPYSYYDPLSQEMVGRNMYSYPVETILSRGGIETHRTKITYGTFPSASSSYSLICPTQKETSQYGGPWRIEVTFNSYDSRGNLTEYTTPDGRTNTLVYSYNYHLPVIDARNAKLEDVQAALRNIGLTLSTIYTMGGINLSILSGLYHQDRLKDAEINLYRYYPLWGLSTYMDPSERVIDYFYDKYGRIESFHNKLWSDYIEYEYEYMPKN